MPIPDPVKRELIVTLERFRKEADRRDAAVIQQLADAYRKLYERLANDLELELRRIYEQPESTGFVRSWRGRPTLRSTGRPNGGAALAVLGAG